MESDSQTVSTTFTPSTGQAFTLALDANEFAPSTLKATASAHRIHAMSLASKVGAVAGVVAASAGIVAGIAALTPGGQGVAVAAGLIGLGATAVVAGAGLINEFTSTSSQ